MSTLLLRLAAPMQAWGTQSRFTQRDTEREPSKSGVIGLLCAALGRPRSAAIDDLAGLRMGVRVDREGTVMRDYHTAQAWTESQTPRSATLSNRYYLADADYLVGLEGPRDLLATVDRALSRPAWTLFLGRKAFVPGLPIRLPDAPPLGPGLTDLGLEQALHSYPWPEDERNGPAERLRFVFDTDFSVTAEVRGDVPISFADRIFSTRNVHTDWREPIR